MPRQEWNDWKERVYETKRIVLHSECGTSPILSDGDVIVSAEFDDWEAILVIRHTENGRTSDIRNVIRRGDIKEVIY